MRARLTALILLGAISAIALAVAPAASQQASVPAPVTYPPEWMATLAKIRDAALASDYAYRQVAHLTENIGPRISGSPQAQQAVEYVAGELRRLGLEVTLEKVMVPHWVRGEERAELTVFPGQAQHTTQRIVLTALGNSPATPPDGITAEVVVVNNFDELAALGREKVAGKIVLYNAKFDERMAAEGRAGEAYGHVYEYRSKGAQAAVALGAVASLMRSLGGADYRIPHAGYSIAAGIPAAAITAEDAQLIADLAQQGRVVMHLVLTPQTLPDVESYNVIGDLKGSEHPEQIVIVSGHLDSWDLGTGAIDDAAGVAVAMQVANLCMQLGLHPKRTLRVIAWMDEENGTTGGAAYAAEHKSDAANHIAAIESDLGSDHPLGMGGTFNKDAMAALQPFTKVLESTGATLLQPNGDSGADIETLADSGVPVFGLIQDNRTYFHYHHTAADTLDKVNPQMLAENAALMAVYAFGIADAPKPLPRQ
ncbi:MAG TPA: M20/M25/M40 family metallo-hydrolase [Candidatus Acidoferrum sp.]|nr:M20/M25/M40 family metallo-hydrolase [Candidatus Acidoferrum sp.]